MNDIITISLTHLRFFAYHGLYAEEKKIGGEFEVNLFVSFNPSGTISSLHDTINYTTLYELLKKEMQQPRELLETFVMEFTAIVHSHFPAIKRVGIAITKLHSPIPAFNGNATVEFSKDF